MDGRGQDITIAGSKQIHFQDTSGGTGSNNLIFLNVHFERTGTDLATGGLVNWNTAYHDTSPSFLAHLEFTGFIANVNCDETLLWGANAPDNADDKTICWNKWNEIGGGRNLYMSHVNTVGSDNHTQNPDKFRAWVHHNHFMSKSRQPIVGMGPQSPAPSTYGYVASSNNFREWDQQGFFTKEYVDGHSEQDTFDMNDIDMPGTPGTYGNRGASVEPGFSDARMKVVNPRVINIVGGQTGYTETDAANVASPEICWPSYKICTADATHDTLLANRAGHTLQLETSGTLDGSAEDAVSGKTLILTLPSTQSWQADLSSPEVRDSIRANVVIWESVAGTTQAGTAIFTTNADVVRTDAQTVTLTASANASISENSVIFYEGADGISSGDYLLSWNYADVVAAAEGGGPSTGQVVVQ